MPHSNITPKTRERAWKLRAELTRSEAKMWNLLRDFRPRGARFRRETPIGPYIADFAWLSKKIVVEVDGDSHETDQGRTRDRVRDAWMKDQGYTVLRFNNADLIDAEDHVFLEIEKAIGRYLDD
ncbi:endonuclease domain-containing protein [Hoeflea sp.]|uniref:endonuclease domain-containing protein n=1 Tax=Hoeflea sp. TaxID=1940281 RepID=UPI003A92F5DB